MAGESGDAASVAMSADERARMVEEQMTDDERFSLLVSVMGVNDVVTVRDERIPEGVPMSAGYVPGVPRLGIPPLLMSDASLGVTNPGYREGDTATALPPGSRWERASTRSWRASRRDGRPGSQEPGLQRTAGGRCQSCPGSAERA